MKPLILAGAVLLSLIAGWTDLRSRRIPNWLTVPGLLVGVVANTVLGGWGGLKTSLLGAVVGLVLLLTVRAVTQPGRGRLETWQARWALSRAREAGRSCCWDRFLWRD